MTIFSTLLAVTILFANFASAYQQFGNALGSPLPRQSCTPYSWFPTQIKPSINDCPSFQEFSAHPGINCDGEIHPFFRGANVSIGGTEYFFGRCWDPSPQSSSSIDFDFCQDSSCRAPYSILYGGFFHNGGLYGCQAVANLEYDGLPALGVLVQGCPSTAQRQ